MSLKFHHIGLACKSINREVVELEKLGYTPVGKVFEDVEQGIRGIFLEGPGPRMELLQDLPGSQTIEPWLKKRGARMYHMAYKVHSIESTIDKLLNDGARLVKRPHPAVAFFGKKVCFLFLIS
jgi:methylmalonyl-CoA/ethylmalonyl-CoA epimerase